MFQINDYVVCGANGVCKVEDICHNPFDESKVEELFYVLKPIYFKENTVYIPKEHPKIIMRKLISKDEALGLIGQIPDIETIWIENDKEREVTYKGILQKLDCYQLIQIIKTLYMRNKERLESGKKATSTDQKYFKLAEKILHEELAIVLDMPENEVGSYIIEKVEQIEGQQAN